MVKEINFLYIKTQLLQDVPETTTIGEYKVIESYIDHVGQLLDVNDLAIVKRSDMIPDTIPDLVIPEKPIKRYDAQKVENRLAALQESIQTNTPIETKEVPLPPPKPIKQEPDDFSEEDDEDEDFEDNNLVLEDDPEYETNGDSMLPKVEKTNEPTPKKLTLRERLEKARENKRKTKAPNIYN